MRGSDRCDEIVRLIDEMLADAPPAGSRKPSPARPGGAAPGGLRRPSSRSKKAADGSERRDLLAAVADFLAGTSPETAPTIA